MATAKLLLVSDYPIVRRGLRALLEVVPKWTIVAEAGNGTSAVTSAVTNRPDLVIVDIAIPRLSDLVPARKILEALRSTRLLLLVQDDRHAIVDAALSIGAHGYVLKGDAERDLVIAVNAVINGQAFLSAVITERLRSACGARRTVGTDGDLTVREAEIISLLADGYSNKEAAQLLGTSTRTVEKQRTQIMIKLRLGSFADMVRYAVRNGMVTDVTSET